VHLLPHAVAAVFRFDDRLVEKIRKIIDMSIDAQNHIAAAPTIAAVRSALWHKFLAAKTDATAPTIARLRKDFDSIDEHDRIVKARIDPRKVHAEVASVTQACHPERSEEPRNDTKITLFSKNVRWVL